jgi:magnesium chelatase accessory protein
MSDLAWNDDGKDWPNRRASTFVEAAGIRWHVQRLGEEPYARRPQLLLVHGTGAATHSWRDLAPLLARHFYVIAPDLPGHAFTQAPSSDRLSLRGMASDLGQLLRVLGVQPDIVVGHSAGAAILARMCLNCQIAPRLLVSLNGAFMPFAGAANRFFSPLAKLMVLNPLVPQLFAWQASRPGTVERLIRGTGSVLEPRGDALYRRLVRNPAHVAAALRMMANWELESLVRELPDLKPQLVLLAAENDRSISPEVAVRVRAMLPRSIIERVPGGHLVHEENPPFVADLIMRHAARTQLTGATAPIM